MTLKDPEAMKAYNRAYYLRTREKQLANAAARYAQDPEKFKENRIAWRKKNPGYKRPNPNKHYRETPGAKQKSWESHLRNVYKGMTAAKYAEMLLAQGGLCAICKRSYTEFERLFALDHDHACCPGKKSCGKCIRGLLCHHCNVGLGQLQDSPALLERALAYLQNNKRYGDKIMSNTNNLFAGLRSAKTFERGTFLKAGASGSAVYQVRVKRAIFKKTRTKGDAFILEFTVEKSTYEADKKKAIAAFGTSPFNLQELEKLLPNAEGTTASWYQSLQDIDIGFGALKSFAASILGQKPEDPEFIEAVEGFMNSVVNEGVINGMLIPVEVVQVKTKKDTDFSLHKWGPIIQEAPAAAVAS
jgi:hypothetical protein